MAAERPKVSDALARSLAKVPEGHRDGPMAALAAAYAAEIDGAESAETRRAALKDLGPRLHAALTALGLAAVTVQAPGVSGGGSTGDDEAPAGLTRDELAARRQADALERLERRAAGRRGPGA